MGWVNGTDIFDKTADALIEADYKWKRNVEPEELDEYIVINPLKVLYEQLASFDWDTEYESEYWDHPIIGQILGNDFEEE